MTSTTRSVRANTDAAGSTNKPVPHEEIDEVLEGLASFIDGFVVPLEEENRRLLEDDKLLYGPDGSYSKDFLALRRHVREESARAGYYTMFCPGALGGGALGNAAMFQAYEFLYRRYGPGRMLPIETIAHWTSGPSALSLRYSDTVAKQVLPRLLSGTTQLCFGMSEPDHGSDAWAMTTSARRDGDDWVVDGVKQWTTHSPYADYCMLFAVTDAERARARRGGISCFVVPMDSPGVSVDSVIRMFGRAGGNEGIVRFDEVRVPSTHLVGDEGEGMALALAGVNTGKIYNSGVAVGIARWAFNLAVDYAQTRVAFGRPISAFQGISFKLADSAMDIHAARLVALDVARRVDTGDRAVRELAMSKAFCVEAAYRVIERAMQTCGAMGLTNEMRLVDGWHHLRSLHLADGSAEILRRTIANRVLAGDRDFGDHAR